MGNPYLVKELEKEAEDVRLCEQAERANYYHEAGG